MKRKTTKRISKVAEETRSSEKQKAQKKAEEQKSNTAFETCSCAEAFAKSGGRLEHLFDRLF